MKRIITAVIALSMILGWGLTGAMAQDVTWDDPFPLSAPKLSDITADDVLYGISEAGAIAIITPSPTIPGTTAVAGPDTIVRDFAVGPKGTLFAVTDTAVAAWSETSGLTALALQPKTPTDIAGIYKHIAYGDGGKLYVLFEAASGAQYILSGHEINDTMLVGFEPKMLNLDSKGNWASCKIRLPEGYSEKDIDPDSVKITRIQVPVTGGVPIDQNVAIFRAPGSPSSADGSSLNVKFLRYDKSNPANLQSLAGEFTSILPAAGKQKATYTATLTVQAQLKTTGEWFEATTGMAVMVAKAKK